jgi:hypothetical protein
MDNDVAEESQLHFIFNPSKCALAIRQALRKRRNEIKLTAISSVFRVYRFAFCLVIPSIISFCLYPL